MNGGDEMEEDDDDDVDFNPYFLQQSPDRESDDSSKRAEDSDDGEEDEEAGEDHGNLVDNRLGEMLGDSELFVGDPDKQSKISELADAIEDRQLEEMEGNVSLDTMARSGCDLSMERNSGTVNVNCAEEIREADLQLGTREDVSRPENFHTFEKPSDRRGSNTASASIEVAFQDDPGEGSLVHMMEGECQPNEHGGADKSEGGNLMDAIFKRTRANLSLTDMSLDQLETFLQESDEEEYFQTVDDEEEYRKFLQAVQEDNDATDTEPNQNERKIDEDDDEDADFEVEIEEALDSDDASESVKNGTRRRPETRGKKQQNGQGQKKSSVTARSSVPLRQLLPHMGKVSGHLSMVERRRAMSERLSLGWPSFMPRSVPVSGFTAHQIGQLYCLMHEHVQLLVQVLSLCVLEPSRQQIAADTQRLLMELVEKREFVLSWKATAFPDFCFRPPYTHPSLVESRQHVTTFQTLSPDTSMPNAALAAQNARILPNFDPRTCLIPGASPDVRSVGPWTQGVGRCLNGISVPFPLLRTPDLSQNLPTAENGMRARPGGCQSWDGQNSSLPAGTPDAHQGQASPPVSEGIGSAHVALPGSVASTRPLGTTEVYLSRSDDLPQMPSSATTSSMTSVVLPPAAPTKHASCTVTPRSGSDPSNQAISYLEGSVIPMIQAASSGECVPPSKSGAWFPKEQARGEWTPITTGPVRSLIDVAPLALIREFLMEVSQVVEDHRKRHVETGDYHMQCEREPLFPVSLNDERDQRNEANPIDGVTIRLLGSGEQCRTTTLPPLKKTMAAALVESTMKESLALVPKDAALATRRFLPYFNKEFFPHKAPPAATAKRLLFTDAEDELLAMGLMMYNTDWRAIQQRYLPSKSQHQIFVRQKNRSSARAAENSIKAVRRMKSSPLNPLETSSIQEGLGVFKHDWNKVWQFCVPHRDPTILPRQWRIAVGTQKSYKTSESSKEKRRLYEASRRQRIKKACMAVANGEENGHLSDGPTLDGEEEGNCVADAMTDGMTDAMTDAEDIEYPPCPKTNLESSTCQPGEKDLDDTENEYIREAFMDNGCAESAPTILEPAEPSGAKQKKSGAKKRKAKALIEPRPPLSALWLDSQAVKKTVKLAPGLPSVKLPSCVQVLSQSQVQSRHPLSFVAGLAAGSMQWSPMTSEHFDQLELSAQAQASHLQALSISNAATEEHRDGRNFVRKVSQSSSRSLAGRNQPSSIKGLKAMTSTNGSSTRKERHVKMPANHLQGSLFPRQPSPEVALAMDAVAKGQPPIESTSSQRPMEVSPQAPSVASAFEPSLVQNLYSLALAATRDEGGLVPRSDCADATSSQAISSPMLARSGFEIQDNTGGKSPGLPQSGAEMEIHGDLRNEKQPTTTDASGSSLVNDQPNKKAVTGTKNVQSGVERNSSQPRPRKKGPEDAKPKRSTAKKSQAGPLQENRRDKQRGKTSKSSIAEDVQDSDIVLLSEGVAASKAKTSRRTRQKTTGKNRNRGPNALQPVRVESHDQDLEQLSIVMEQEELTDSEDEVDADVEFEQEEMGDSDKDDDL